MMVGVQILLVFLVSSSAWASDNVAKILLKADMATYTRPLSRDIYVYSHRNAMQLGVWNLRDAQEKGIEGLKDYQQETHDYHLFDKGMVGKGLYAAADPYTSGDYGKLNYRLQVSNWVLGRIKIPKGSKLLDIRSGGDQFPISFETLEALKDVCFNLISEHNLITRKYANPAKYPPDAPWSGSIPSRIIDGKRWFFISKQGLTRLKSCHNIFLEALKELEVTSILYKWGGHHPKECDGKKRNQESAFLLVNNDLSDENVDIFTKRMPEADLEEEAKKIHYAVERHYRASSRSRHWSGFASNKVHWDKFEDEGIGLEEDPKLRDYLRETKFGCGKKYEEEDSPKFSPEKGLEVLINELPKAHPLNPGGCE